MGPPLQATERIEVLPDPAPAPAPASRRRWITAAVLGLVIASLLSFRLSGPELDVDEITYMSRVLESMSQGTVLPVEGNGAPFMNKPPLALWLMRLSFQVLGPSPFAARLPSVLAGAATAVLLYLFGAARFSEGTGILAALIFALTPGLLAVHAIRSSTTDALEILLVTAAIVALESWRRGRRPWALARMVACVGATAWVKSPFALLVFLAVLLATEWPARRAGQGTPRLGVTLVWVAGIWLALYALWLGTLSSVTSTRAVTNQLLRGQYERRIEGRIGPHQGPGYYPAVVARDFGPLLLLPAGAAAVGILALRRSRSAPPYEVTLLLAWSLAAPLLGTAAVSKLPWYAYLSYPGIATLLAASADRLARAISSRRAVQSALLAAAALAPAGRLPADRLWPAEAQHRGPVGRLWDVASRDPRIQVVAGPDFRFPRQRDLEHREARFFVRLLLWRADRVAPSPGSCQMILLSAPPEGPDARETLQLEPSTPQDDDLYLLDRCGGVAREQIVRP